MKRNDAVNYNLSQGSFESLLQMLAMNSFKVGGLLDEKQLLAVH